jgi:hypothetical protein
MKKCRNCGHNILFSDEYETWIHEIEYIQNKKDDTYNIIVEDEDRRCGLCLCQKPEPKVK